MATIAGPAIQNLPYVRDLEYRGFVKGHTIISKASGDELCHYFGGIPYALPPVGVFRWKHPRPLPACYRYGTRGDPADCTGKASISPQPKSTSPLVDEDCLQCNVWIPAGKPPKLGWPVYFYIHGGFLQIGNANSGNPTALLSESPFKAIIVKPAYRLNILGFLASEELLADSGSTTKSVGNLGFWDLRLALEWTQKNISYFKGDASNITIGGYSAGAHAAFYQLAYDLELPPSKRAIRRIVMQSNGPGVQPKSLREAQLQFDELLTVLKIPKSLLAKEKLERLRATTAKSLIDAIPRMRLHQFRAVTDGVFVRHTLFSDIVDGTFGQKMLMNNIRLLTGECSDEHHVYGRYYAPGEIFDSVISRLEADYPQRVVTALSKHYFPEGKLGGKYKSWQEAFGKIYADVQIHVSQRGFLDGLIKGGGAKLIQRYRIEWRSELADLTSPRQWGATHGADNILWFLGDGHSLTNAENEIIRSGLIDLLAQFVAGQESSWGTRGPLQVRRLNTDGVVDSWFDELWYDKLKVWDSITKASLEQKVSRL